MAPIAVDAAGRLGADGFSFLLAGMFASALSLMTPVGYQTESDGGWSGATRSRISWTSAARYNCC
jgi:hypothetical protein